MDKLNINILYKLQNIHSMSDTEYECEMEPSAPIRVPLMKLQMPGIKTTIHKRKDCIDPGFNKKKMFLAIKKTPERSMTGLSLNLKKNLTISIPSDAEVKAFTPGSRVKTVSNYADTNEAGMFYGVTLKKGSFRRSNEDRVSNFFILNSIVHYISIFCRDSHQPDGRNL